MTQRMTTELDEAILTALKSAALASYEAWLHTAMDAPLDTRLEMAITAFRRVCARMPAANRFRLALERYMRDQLADDVRRDGGPGLSWAREHG
jgi:hypothetical protein